MMTTLVDEDLKSSGIDNLGPATTIVSMDSYLVKDKVVIISKFGPIKRFVEISESQKLKNSQIVRLFICCSCCNNKKSCKEQQSQFHFEIFFVSEVLGSFNSRHWSTFNLNVFYTFPKMFFYIAYIVCLKKKTGNRIKKRKLFQPINEI